MIHTKPIKVVFIGNGGCGKTTFLHMIRTGNFERKYIPTMGVEANPIGFTPYEETKNINFSCWDCAGQERYGGKENYYIGAHTIVICFSVNSNLEVKSIPMWLRMAKSASPTNIMLMGMKHDLSEIKNLNNIIAKYELPFCMVSSKTNTNLNTPLQMIYESV